MLDYYKRINYPCQAKLHKIAVDFAAVCSNIFIEPYKNKGKIETTTPSKAV